MLGVPTLGGKCAKRSSRGLRETEERNSPCGGLVSHNKSLEGSIYPCPFLV